MPISSIICCENWFGPIDCRLVVAWSVRHSLIISPTAVDPAELLIVSVFSQEEAFDGTPLTYFTRALQWVHASHIRHGAGANECSHRIWWILRQFLLWWKKSFWTKYTIWRWYKLMMMEILIRSMMDLSGPVEMVTVLQWWWHYTHTHTPTRMHTRMHTTEQFSTIHRRGSSAGLHNPDDTDLTFMCVCVYVCDLVFNTL